MNNTVRGSENIVAKLWDEYSVKEYRPILFELLWILGGTQWKIFLTPTEN